MPISILGRAPQRSLDISSMGDQSLLATGTATMSPPLWGRRRESTGHHSIKLSGLHSGRGATGRVPAL
ncbi:hypothetical protein B0T16DRAFT_121617 [Cercophora newfieldiana]|uniref:Uncharacterized protein n=1 Tax=Cercophora newfieldiana TaxID=92897 RepID=A0AA40CSB4_9PEZI|nr:hypothetical protein B0T16DRAFT_121617 [Cercophora newfieldiana]